jgi:hypothetical protein
MMLIDEAPAAARYRNQWPWRVMPPEEAASERFFDRSFGNKRATVGFQKQVKIRFPNEPCCLIHIRRYFDALGRSYDTKH